MANVCVYMVNYSSGLNGWCTPDAAVFATEPQHSLPKPNQ